MSGSAPRRSVYVSPAAVVAAPDYARRLVDEAGVDCFVLRTGFDPTATSSSLGQSVGLVKALDVRCWFLVGTWWGDGVDPADEAMTAVADDLLTSDSPAHEARFQMHSPGGRQDDAIESALQRLCREFAPDGVCLTHARYRHPAAISGMFEVGGPAFRAVMDEYDVSEKSLRAALLALDSNLTGMKAAAVRDHVRGQGVADFLDSVAGVDVFTRWFRIRAELVTRSVRRFGQAVKGVTTTASFGTNASGPGSAFECGQDYAALVGQCDFVQPLLGYIDWHVMQPVNAWRDYLTARVHGLSTRDAAAISATLFGLGDGSLSSYSSALAPGHGEGTPEGIQQVVLRQLDLLEAIGLPLTALLPVLRGRDWPTDVTRSLAQQTDVRGFGGVVYQGTAALAGPVPVEGWA